MKRATSFLAAALVLLTILSFSNADAQTNGPGGHYYQVVREGNLLWEEARIKAAQSTFNGVHGYLATITSAEEDQFVDSLRAKIDPILSVWLGGWQQTNTLSSTEGWFWVNGEGAIPGQNGGTNYSNWINGDPNDPTGPDSEQFLAMGAIGHGWTSEADDRHVQGYVVEYPSAGVAARVSVVTIDPVATEDPSAQPDDVDIATFEFRRVGDLSQDLAIFYAISGTASNGDDYDEISRSIVIPAGESAASLDIIPHVNDVGITEGMETVGIRIEPSLILTPEAAYTIDSFRREAGAVIYETQPPQSGALELAIPPGGTTYQFGEQIVLLAALSFSNQVPTVDFYSTDLNTGSSNKLGFAYGINRKNELAFYRFPWTNAVPGDYFVTALTTNKDGLRLGSLPFRVTIASATNVPIVRIRSVALDNTNPTPPGDYPSGYFEIIRSGPTNENLQVFYTISGNATAGLDYEPLASYAVIGANRTSARITVSPIDDELPEDTEILTLSLIDSTNSISPAYILNQNERQASVSIIDADTVLVTNVVVSIESSVPEIWEPYPEGLAGKFTVRRTGQIDSELTVAVAFGGTATPGLDYTAETNSVRFLRGQSEVVRYVEARPDDVVEPTETVIMQLVAQPSLYTVDPAKANATVAIRDRDSLPTVSIEATQADTWEPYPEGLDGKFTVRRTGPLDNPLTVWVALGGTATLNLDYTANTNSVEFLPGQSEVVRYVTPLPDDLVETNETVLMQLIGQGSFYNNDPAKDSATVVIHDRDSLPTVSIEATQPDIWEPYPETLDGIFTVRRTGPLDGPLTVWVFFGGTARLNLDYTATTNSVEFLPGQSEVVRYITPLPDDLVETNETVGMQLIGRGLIYNVDRTKAFATVVIHDRDSLPNVTVEATRPDTWELSGETLPGQFTIRRVGPTNEALSVYVLFGGTAKLGLDYTANTNSVEFAAGQSEVIRNITPLADGIVETNETVILQLIGHGSVYNLDQDTSRATVTIHEGTEPDPLPTVSVEATQPDTWEPHPESLDGKFTVRRTGPLDGPLTVWVFFGGTATLNLDYTANTNSVEFLPGQSEVVRYITPLPDDLVETNETVGMQLIGRGLIYNVDRTKAFATVVIHDRDSLPNVTVEATRPDTWELSGETLPGQFTIRRIGPTNEALSVYVLFGGTAKLGLDYTANTNLVEFSLGQSEVIRNITPLADGIVETNETVILQLIGHGSVYNLDPDTSRATVTIHDGTSPEQSPEMKLGKCARYDDGVHLTLHAQAGQKGTLQRSADFVNWEDVTALTFSYETVDYVDTDAQGEHLFYRLKAQ